jgi:hypothetical protein
VRARFPTWAVFALGALTVGALSIAVTLAASDADKWPGWLQPYHRWGWWSVLGLLAAAVALAAWQVTRQAPSTTPSPPTTVHAADSGPAAGRDVAISGAQGPTAGRDAQIVTGGAGPTAGGDVHITTITTTGPVTAPTASLGAVVAAGPISNLPPRNLAFTGREELLDRLHQQLTMPTAAVAVTALADENAAPGGAARNAEASQAELHAPRVLHGLGAMPVS